MTNLEALKAVVGIDAIGASSFEKALIDINLVSSDNYVAVNASTINAAALNVLKGFLYSSISEGGYSVSFDRTAIENKITVLEGNKVRGIKRLTI